MVGGREGTGPLTAPGGLAEPGASRRAGWVRSGVASLRIASGRADVLALAWIVLLAAAYLAPALKDGSAFGPADLGRGLSLLTRILPVAPALHNSINGDTITQGVPWNTLDWTIVHHGQLPLWNDLSGTGVPQMFNFESAPLSLPTMLGYLAPLSASYLVSVAAKLVVAGTGAYVACRVLGCRPLAGALGGTSFMLAGSFSGWLGWSVDGPVAWAGWILAGCVLAYRSRHTVREVVLLAASVAFCLYAGFPESYVLLAVGLGVVLVATGGATLARRRRIAARGVARIAAGALAGGMLAAPLLLPGVSLLAGSARNGKDAATGIPLHLATLLFAQGYDGLPLSGSTWFGQVNYYETAAYVGIAAIVLAGVALLTQWRRPAVVGLGASVVAGVLVVYQLGAGAPVQHLLARLGLSAVALQRMQMVLELPLALLAALGLESVVRRWQDRATRLALAASSAVVLAVVAFMWTRVGDARLPPATSPPKSPPSVATLESLRRASLIWPTATVALVLVLLAVATVSARSAAGRARGATGRVLGLALLGAQSSFLVFAGVGINSYSHDAFPVTPAVARLRSIVGTTLLGLDSGNRDCGASSPRSGPFCGVRLWRGTGLYPVMNVGYALDELAMHDPMTPQAYFDAWPVPNADQVTPANLNLFAPDVDSVALARLYGVSYVLALPGLPAPAGMRPVADLSGEELYSVPRSARFSFDRSGSRSGASVTGVSHPGDARYVVHVHAPVLARLEVRVTDVSGWHATADGQPVAIEAAPGDLMSIVLPAGTTVVVLHYWPRRLSEGIALALVALLALLAWPLSAVAMRRSRRGAIWRTRSHAAAGARPPGAGVVPGGPGGPEGGAGGDAPLVPSAGG
ncbi:MAG: hypothetical protein M0Z33_04110 [Actinomycetota bacterium]|nr:hypothetical protein [Actinomycetota bacterium]